MKRKIAVLGGGMASLAAVHELTRLPGWRDRHEITVYQLGWRLGGKGSSGCNPDAHDRIEEHGLHVLWGFYENTFRLLRECYDELGRAPGAPLATLSAAFLPHDAIVLPSRGAGGWTFRPMTCVRNAGVPGSGVTVSEPWDYVSRLLHAVTGLLGVEPDAPTQAALGEEVPRLRRLMDRVGRSVEGAAATVGAALEGAVRSVVGRTAVAAVNVAQGLREILPSILGLELAGIIAEGAASRPALDDEAESREVLVILDVVGASLRRYLGDRVPYAKPFDTWADMTHLLDRERWPAGARPASLAYLTARLDETEPVPPRGPSAYPARVRSLVATDLSAWLGRSAHALWPDATTTHDPRAVDWRWLHDPEERDGAARLGAQFVSPIPNPSNRYVIAAPGTNQHRLRPDASGYENLVLAGDWTLTSLSIGCMEAAAMSGNRAAAAIDPGVRPAIGDWLTELDHARRVLPVPLRIRRSGDPEIGHGHGHGHGHGSEGIPYHPPVAPSPADTLRFPPGFRWGISTSAYQVEGGETPSQWHAWEAAGRIKNGDVRGAACDWWAHAERDFDLARDLGVNALRISLDWARLEPRRGVWDDRAFARYREMLAGLSARGIRPMITLHHFAHPVWLEMLGGFDGAEAVGAFGRFARKAAEELGAGCEEWVTFNEPNVFAVQGYLLGEFPPGKKGDVAATLRVMGNLARAHAAAYRAVHEAQPGARVGFTQHFLLFDPERPGRRLDRLVVRVQDALFNEAFPRMIETGRAPLGSAMVTGDTSEARGTCDFAGANLYGRTLLGFDAGRAGDMFARRSLPEGARRGDTAVDSPFGEAYPQGIGRVVERLARLGKPIYVLENGVPDAGDRVRPWVVARAAAALHGVIRRGFDVRGYYHWTLVDNFEWAEGWSLRFGLVALDPATGVRTPRGSAGLYGALARGNALTREDVARWAPEALAEVFP